MLNTLSVRNIVLIDQLDLSFEPGLTVLTGETGAGKSILLDALTLALGGRGDAALVRTGADSGQVVAVAHLPERHPARVYLRENEIADDAEIILRRVQHADGRTRAFVNDQPVSAGLLRAVGGLIVEIHGQHDDRALVDPATHRALLDAFGGHRDDLERTRAAHGEYARAQKAVTEQRARVERAEREEEFARHVVDELSALKPEVGEEEQLAERRAHLMSLEKAAGEVTDAEEILNGPNAPGPSLAMLLRRLTRKSDAEAALFAPMADAVDAALVALDGASEALDAIRREMAFDPRELEQVEERLFALRAAARKHQVDCDELSDVLARYAADIAALESGAETLAQLEAELSAAEAAYRDNAKALSAAREAAGHALSAAVEAELPDLKLGSARFIVAIESDPDRMAATGFDQVAFHVQTNPGTAAGPMMKVASGGELSRFLLALKVVLADKGSVPVLVFDEIDTGVGGAVADAIGKRLGRLAGSVQVLTVTHAPQVAARAMSHLLIEKQAIEEGAFVRTNVRPLDTEARREELARMLAGATVTDEARAAAHRLMSEAPR
ncbi:DNA repair protein RecN [Pelagibacterium montanilacus]|uniref:DNA repair protein RecN n=1 Tax=Pelagibacterium montanilacus TaxID=2185280 RepID=UPI000F8E224E|nr:DNA repair protein RecN [Pelagibacterium montanilacus]